MCSAHTLLGGGAWRELLVTAAELGSASLSCPNAALGCLWYSACSGVQPGKWGRLARYAKMKTA